jgi:hypothetical protein
MSGSISRGNEAKGRSVDQRQRKSHLQKLTTGLVIVGTALLIWQVAISEYASYTVIGLGMIIVALGLGIGVYNKVLSTSFVIGVFVLALTIALVVFKPIRFAMFPSLSSRLQGTVIAATLAPPPPALQSGERALLQVVIENQSDEVISFDKLRVELPKDFFEGFVVVYPTSPPHKDVKDGGTWTTPPSDVISFADIVVAPNSRQELTINVAANVPGDYSGRYQVFGTARIGKSKFGWMRLLQNANVAVVP